MWWNVLTRNVRSRLPMVTDSIHDYVNVCQDLHQQNSNWVLRRGIKTKKNNRRADVIRYVFSELFSTHKNFIFWTMSIWPWIYSDRIEQMLNDREWFPRCCDKNQKAKRYRKKSRFHSSAFKFWWETNELNSSVLCAPYQPWGITVSCVTISPFIPICILARLVD